MYILIFVSYLSKKKEKSKKERYSEFHNLEEMLRGKLTKQTKLMQPEKNTLGNNGTTSSQKKSVWMVAQAFGQIHS